MGIKNKNASKIISSELNIFEAFLFIRDHGGNTFVQSFEINYILVFLNILIKSILNRFLINLIIAIKSK